MFTQPLTSEKIEIIQMSPYPEGIHSLGFEQARTNPCAKYSERKAVVALKGAVMEAFTEEVALVLGLKE